MPTQTPGSGPKVARAFHVALSAIFLTAWWSLGRQVHVLVGEHGLLPAEPWLAALRKHPDVGWTRVPTLFLIACDDRWLTLGIIAGALLSLLSLLGVLSRPAFALNAALYLSFTLICHDFLAFQWDNLLLECAFLAAFLPAHRRARFAHILLRILLFKLYFESGLAKWQSPLGDWQDGSAMTYYYETAPLPTWVAWHAYHLPTFWHHLESWATLCFELIGPLFIFGPRTGRLVVFAVFTVFQLANIATANYGFFSYLALALHLFLLDDRDIERAARLLRGEAARLRRRFSTLRRVQALTRLASRQLAHLRMTTRPRFTETSNSETLAYLLRIGTAALVSTIYVSISLESGIRQFWAGGPNSETAAALANALRPFRLVNNYHLFASITRSRIEPTFEVHTGTAWRELALHYKPGPVNRPPPFVAPHQPRVDFRLWFYGLSHARSVPPYVASILRHLCDDPTAIQPLFVDPLPPSPTSARVSFYDYHFSTAGTKARTGAWWTRTPVDEPRGLACAHDRPTE